jgi:hypothetical protein
MRRRIAKIPFLQPLRIHLQQGTAGSDPFDALRCGFNNHAQPTALEFQSTDGWRLTAAGSPVTMNLLITPFSSAHYLKLASADSQLFSLLNCQKQGSYNAGVVKYCFSTLLHPLRGFRPKEMLHSF